MIQSYPTIEGLTKLGIGKYRLYQGGKSPGGAARAIVNVPAFLLARNRCIISSSRDHDTSITHSAASLSVTGVPLTARAGAARAGSLTGRLAAASGPGLRVGPRLGGSG